MGFAIFFAIVTAYLAVAIFAFRLAGKWFPAGPWRPVVRGSVFAFFFGLGFADGGHGLPMPFPLSFIVPEALVNCDFLHCDTGNLKWALYQWAAVVAIFLAPYAIQWVNRRRLDRAVKGSWDR